MRTLAALLALVLAVPASGQQPDDRDSGFPLLPEQGAFDATYYRLDLAIDPEAKTLGGTMLMESRIVTPTDVIVLDLDDALAVEGVEQVGYLADSGDEVTLPLRFERIPNQIRIHLGRTAQPLEGLRVRVAYGGTPREAPRPPWDGGLTWAETEDGRPWVAVSCQIQGADLWWPVKDHPSDEADSVRVALTVPADLRAVANGVWEGRTDNGDGTATETWFASMPTNNYGVSFGVAPYEVVERPYESPAGWSQTVPFYVLPERVADAERQMPGFLDALAFLERTFGPYPWRADGYKVLHTPYLGMEHQTVVAYGSTFEDNAFGFDWLHFHELAHEWWANLGTAPDWRDFWVHESFANYAEALYAEDIARRNGEDADAAYLRYMMRSRGSLRNVIPVAPRETRTTEQMYQLPDGRSNGDIYSKGGWVLHSMRYLIGDDARFFEALRGILYPAAAFEAMTDGRQARFVTTADVLRALSLAAGRDLSGEFEVYLRQPALPRLGVERDGVDLVLRWMLPEAAADARFEVPVEVVVGGEARRVEMPGGVGRTPVPEGAAWEVDPNVRVLFDLAE
ncbi:MAG: M1 family metallopeptidase [Bacteroidota bacterium]